MNPHEVMAEVGRRNLKPIRPGARFGRLRVLERHGSASRHATWLCICDCGRRATARGNHLREGRVLSCGCLRRNDRPVIAYTTAHQRVWRLRGAAAAHACVDCGGTADQWAYDHDDPSELLDERGRPYSLDPAHYAPRCLSCHRKHDLKASRSK